MPTGVEVARGSRRGRARGRRLDGLDLVGAHASRLLRLDAGRRAAAGARPACRGAPGSRCAGGGRGGGRARRSRRCRRGSGRSPAAARRRSRRCNALAALTSSAALRRTRGRPRSAASSLIGVARLEPRLHVGEAVLERLVRGQRPAERVAVERPLDGHVEARPASRRPTRRWRSRGRAAAGARPAASASPTSPTTARRPARRTPSKVTVENRRVRSTVRIGVDRDARRRRPGRAPG